jgi:hypothetical protein
MGSIGLSAFHWQAFPAQCNVTPGNTKEGSITVQSTFCLTGFDLSVLQIKTKIVNSHTANSKPVKEEVNGTAILPPLVFPGNTRFVENEML